MGNLIVLVLAVVCILFVLFMYSVGCAARDGLSPDTETSSAYILDSTL